MGLYKNRLDSPEIQVFSLRFSFGPHYEQTCFFGDAKTNSPVDDLGFPRENTPIVGKDKLDLK